MTTSAPAASFFCRHHAGTGDTARYDLVMRVVGTLKQAVEAQPLAEEVRGVLSVTQLGRGLAREVLAWQAHLLRRAPAEYAGSAWALRMEAAYAMVHTRVHQLLREVAEKEVGEGGSSAAAPAGVCWAGLLAQLGAQALHACRQSWQQAQRAGGQEAADATVTLCLLVMLIARNLRLLPCTLGDQDRARLDAAGTTMQQAEYLAYTYSSVWGTPVRAAAARLALPHFWAAFTAAAAVLHKLVDSGALASVPGTTIPRPANSDRSGFGIEEFAGGAGEELALAAPAVAPYTGSAPAGWVDADVAGACAAAEAAVRLISKLGMPLAQYGQPPASEAFAWAAVSWLDGVRQASHEDARGQQGEGRRHIPLGTARVALAPAMHAATSAAKLVHAVLAAPAGRQCELFGDRSSAVVYCANLLSSATVSA